MLLFLLISLPEKSLAQATAETPTERIELKVKGITCSMDLKMIAANVEALEGVSSCETLKEGPTSTMAITYNPAIAEEKRIHEVIEDTGACDNPEERPYKVKK